MINALITGELASAPVERTTQGGKTFTTATVRVAAGAEALFIGVAAFGETAAGRLAQLKKGSAIAAAGTLEQNVWTMKDGEERRGWRLTASEILSVYQARKRREVDHDDDER